MPTTLPGDPALTQEIKDYALRELNADLIGFADRARYANAPARMSPQGLMPESRSMLAQHPPIEKRHPCNFDACILACPYTRIQIE